MAWFCRFYIPKLDEPKLQIPDVRAAGGWGRWSSRAVEGASERLVLSGARRGERQGARRPQLAEPGRPVLRYDSPSNHWRWSAPTGDQFTILGLQCFADSLQSLAMDRLLQATSSPCGGSSTTLSSTPSWMTPSRRSSATPPSSTSRCCSWRGVAERQPGEAAGTRPQLRCKAGQGEPA